MDGHVNGDAITIDMMIYKMGEKRVLRIVPIYSMLTFQSEPA